MVYVAAIWGEKSHKNGGFGGDPRVDGPSEGFPLWVSGTGYPVETLFGGPPPFLRCLSLEGAPFRVTVIWGQYVGSQSLGLRIQATCLPGWLSWAESLLVFIF